LVLYSKLDRGEMSGLLRWRCLPILLFPVILIGKPTHAGYLYQADLERIVIT